MPGTLCSLERSMGAGGWGIVAFFPYRFQPSFNFLPGFCVPFQRELLDSLGFVLGKKWSFLFIGLDRVLSLSRELVCWAQLLFALPGLAHPFPQPSGRQHPSQDPKKFQLKCSCQMLGLVCLFVCLFKIRVQLTSSKSVKKIQSPGGFPVTRSIPSLKNWSR